MSENSTTARAEEEARTNELPHHIATLLYTPQALPAQVLERSELRIAYVPGVMPGKWFTRLAAFGFEPWMVPLIFVALILISLTASKIRTYIADKRQS